MQDGVILKLDKLLQKSRQLNQGELKTTVSTLPVEVDEFAKAEGCITCLVECWEERPPSRSGSIP